MTPVDDSATTAPTGAGASPGVTGGAAPTDAGATTRSGNEGAHDAADTAEPLAGPNPVHPGWEAEAGTWKVYGVAVGDVLNVRSGAGADFPAVAQLAPDATGLTVYTPIARVGDAIWQPVGVQGGSGWVNTRFLRPDAATSPETVGTRDEAMATAASSVVEALEQRDYSALSGAVHQSRGVLISPDAFVADDDVVLSAAEVAAAGTDTQERLWGYTDGEGLPIERTIAEQLGAIAGSTALTSTQRIGFDQAVQNGNTVDNLADKFPGIRLVEYNYPGTEQHDGFDWTSVRFVFDTAGGGEPRLLAIIQDNWTI